MGKWKPRVASRYASARADDGLDRALAAATNALAGAGTRAVPRRSPDGRVAASAIIVELMDPLRRRMDIDDDKRALETLGLMCATAWNASRLLVGERDKHAEVEAARAKVKALDPEFAPVFEALLLRASSMYPEDRRMIMGVTVDILGGGELRVNAASVGGDD